MSNFAESMIDDLDPDQNYFDDVFSGTDYCNESKYFTLSEFNKLVRQEPNYITLVSSNIRSFNANSDSFLSGFEDNFMPDLFVLSETWFNESNVCDIKGYSSHHTFREVGRSGGVSIFYGDHIAARKVDELSYSNMSIEVCTAEVSMGGEVWFVVGVYRPHSDTSLNFDMELNNILSHPVLGGKSCIVMGDFNIDLMNPHNDGLHFVNNMNSKHFINTITKPTRICGSNPSLLDHIWINKPTVYTCGIVLENTTDHCPTFLRLSHRTANVNDDKFKITFRQTSDETSRTSFFNAVQDFDWDSIKSDDVNLYLNSFMNRLKDLICKHFPVKTKHVTRKHFENPWVTPSIRKLLKIKSNMFKLYKDNVISKETNNKMKNKIKTIVDRSKLTHENEKPSALKKLRPLLRRAKKVCRLESMGMCAPPPPRWEGRQSFWKWNT